MKQYIVIETFKPGCKDKVYKRFFQKCYLEDTRRGKRTGHQWTVRKEQVSSILKNHKHIRYAE